MVFGSTKTDSSPSQDFRIEGSTLLIGSPADCENMGAGNVATIVLRDVKTPFVNKKIQDVETEREVDFFTRV